MGKGGKAQTVGYKYYLGMHLGLCHGPIDAITRLRVDDRDVWSGYATGGQINVQASEVFGGDKREGGVSGLIDVEMGGQTQGKNSYLMSKLGALIPAYRGVVGLVFRQCYLGNNPYLKKWNARGQRIFKRHNGEPQWYAIKAAISQDITGTATYTVNLNANVHAGLTSAVGVTLNGFSPGDSLLITLEQNGVYTAYSFYPSDGEALPGQKPWHNTLQVTKADGSTVAFGNAADDGVLYYENGFDTAQQAHDAFPGGFVSGSTGYTFWIYDTLLGNRGGLSLHIIKNPFVDMNAAHIIRECLTDAEWGMGYTEDDIDEESFVAAANTFYSEGLGVSLLWDKTKKIEDFVASVQEHVDTALYVSRTTGKFVLKPIRGGYDEATLLHLDESNIVSVEDPTRVTFGELTNSVTVSYWDATTGKDASLTVNDTALIQQQGVVINAPLQYPGFTNSRNATIAAQRDLRALSAPLLSCTITADAEAKGLNIGDVFKFSWKKWGLVEIVMRVSGISYGTGRNNRVKIQCTQDVFDTDLTVSIVLPENGWDNPSAAPTASDYELATEAPYYELVQLLGQADADNKLLTHPEIGYLIAASSRAPYGINASLFSDNGDGYEDVGVLDFAPVGTLTTAITKTQTSFFIENVEDVAQVIMGTHFQVGDELMRVDELDLETGEVTVGRGVLDTVPQEHAEGDAALFWDQFAGFDPTEYVEGEEVNAKIIPISGAGVLPFDEADELPVEMSGRAARPYAPGDLRINGESYEPGALYVDELTISWTHRNRLEQTGGFLTDHTAGNIGPEAGVKYRLQGYVDDVLVHTEDDIDGTETTWLPASVGIVKVEVHANRLGTYSWQAPWHTFTNQTSGSRFTEDGDERYDEHGDERYSEN